MHKARGNRFPHFSNVMQRDLFDMLGSLGEEEGAFLPKRKAGSFVQASLLPHEKTEEQMGKEATHAFMHAFIKSLICAFIKSLRRL